MSNGGGGLRIRLLGTLAASYDGVPVDLGGPQQRAVLAMLVLYRDRGLSADRIIDYLWDDQPPARALPTLQSYISHLRRRLEPDAAAGARSGVIVRQGRGYAVRLPDDAVDMWRFEQLLEPVADDAERVRRLTEALALWRGGPLAEYAHLPWAQPEVSRLAEMRSVARELLAAARVDRGDAAVMVAELEAMASEEPLREERWRLLALALYRANRQGDALNALRRARQSFADELGIDPGPALRALEADILAQSPALHASARTAMQPAAAVMVSAPAPAAPDDEATDLVDRARELARITQAISDLSAGRSTRLIVEGPAGIGKTRLLDELRHRATAGGLRVLAARGSQLEQSFGYGVVRQLLEPAVTDELLQGAAGPARAVFDLAAEHVEGSLAVLHGLYSLTTRLATDAPLVLSIDNIQWADGPSLRFLNYFARRTDGLRLRVSSRGIGRAPNGCSRPGQSGLPTRRTPRPPRCGCSRYPPNRRSRPNCTAGGCWSSTALSWVATTRPPPS